MIDLLRGEDVMDKKKIINHIKALSFSSDLSQLFSILEKNLDRVEFTKDYDGLRDFIFLAESQTNESEFPFIACFDFKSEHDFINEGVYNEIVYDIPEMCIQLKRFFSTFARPLYVSIGFKESVLSSEDMLYIHTMIENNQIKNQNEGEAKLQKFPDWYVAKYPSEILEDVELMEMIEKLKEKESELVEQMKEELYEQIDQALDTNNPSSFQTLTTKLKMLEER